MRAPFRPAPIRRESQPSAFSSRHPSAREWRLHAGPGRALITINMFTKNSKPRPRGRPPGRTAEGDATRRRLYETAIGLIGERGFEATTLRDVASRAGVSAGLLYRYFPSKRSIVLALYDDLSDSFARGGRGPAAGEMAGPVRLRARDEPPRARTAQGHAASARSDDGGRRRGRRVRTEHRLLSPAGAGRLSEPRIGATDAPAPRLGRSDRQPALPAAPRGHLVVGCSTRVRRSALPVAWLDCSVRSCPALRH